MPEGKNFSNNEVMALVESFRNDIRGIAEDLSSVKDDVSILKEDMTEVKTDLILIKDAVRVAIPALTQRVNRLESKAGI